MRNVAETFKPLSSLSSFEDAASSVSKNKTSFSFSSEGEYDSSSSLLNVVRSSTDSSSVVVFLDLSSPNVLLFFGFLLRYRSIVFLTSDSS